jgi:ABC-2 type transport system ATP-binding protein
MVGLAHVAHRPIGEFSKGMTRRVGLAQALINDPDLLILDEPTSGMDPIGTRQVKDLLLELGRRGKTILLSSHLLADVEDVCDRMVVLYAGRIRAQGTVDELLRDTQRTVIEAGRLASDTISQIERVIQKCEGKGIDRVEAPRQRLEQFFMDLVERARAERIETSGVIHGGPTARFLRGEEEEGEALIEALTRPGAGEPGPSAREVLPAAPLPAAREEVVEGLLAPRAPTAPAAAEPGGAPPPAGEEPPEVDRSVIESLLAEGGEPDQDHGRDRR